MRKIPRCAGTFGAAKASAASTLLPRKKPLVRALSLALTAGMGAMLSQPASATYWQIQNKQIGTEVVAGDKFGTSVDLDAGRMIVGADSDNGQANDAGAVYIYERSKVDGSWTQIARLVAADGVADDGFGAAVAVSGDTVAVGAPGHGTGAVYVFTVAGGNWSQQTKIVHADSAAGDEFGASLALDGDRLVVGAYRHDGNAGVDTDSGAAYFFQRLNAVWDSGDKVEGGAASDWFGYSVALQGNTAAVGAVRSGANGGVFVFGHNGSAWSQTQPLLTAADGATSDFFGSSLDLDGDALAIGASQDDGDTTTDSGSAYVFSLDNGSWTFHAKMTAADAQSGDQFGDSVSISGPVIAVGAHGDDENGADAGGVYIYVDDDNGGLLSKGRLAASDATAGDRFGKAVALDGDILAVAASFDDDNGPESGSVHSFEHAVDLSVTMSDSSSSGFVQSGTNLTYSIVVSNADTEQDASSVNLTDTLPVGVTLVSANVTAGDGDCPVSDNTMVSCELGTLDAGGDSATVELVITVIAPPQPPNRSAGSPALQGISAPAVMLGNSASASASNLDADGSDNSDSVSTEINAIPVANDGSFNVFDNTAFQNQLSATDLDGDKLSFLVVKDPTQGSVTIATGGGFTYTPNQGYTGGDSFTFQVSDTKQNSAAATVDLTVQLEPRPPMAQDDTGATDEDNNATGTLVASDPNLDALSYSVTRQPQHGSAIIDGSGLWSYTPANRGANYQVDFEVTVSANGETTTATVTVDVTADDDAPVVNDDSGSSPDESTPATGTIVASDPEGDTLSYTIGSQPAPGYGSASVDPGTGLWTYTPANRAANYQASFTVNGSANGQSDSGTVTVSVAVTNVAPTSTSATISTDEDTVSSAVTPSVKDVDAGDSHTFSIVSQPLDNQPSRSVLPGGNPGVASVVNDQLVFTPSADWFGNTSFVFRATDLGGNTVDGVASVTVNAVNDNPASAVASITAVEDGGASAGVDATVVDVDNVGGPHTLSIVSQGTKGVASVVNNQLVYTPSADAEGADSFTFSATDDQSGSVNGTATVSITPVNDAPTATSAAISTPEDTVSAPKTPDVTDIDVGDSHTFAIVSQPANGSAAVVNNQLVFTPNANFVGSDSFTFSATDTGGEAVTGTATVSVGSNNDAPSATSASIATNEDSTSAPAIPSVTDVDDTLHAFTIVSQPANGTAAVVNNQLVYTPNANFNGSDSFTFRATDDESGSVTGTATVTVAAINDAPTATSAAIATSEDLDSALAVPTVNDIDSGDSHSFSILTQPTKGTAAVVNNRLLYSPTPNSNGPDSFAFRATDSAGAKVDGTATVTVNSVNDAPSATSASISTSEDNASAALSPSVTDVDDSAHTISLTTQPANGTATVVNNQLVYTPNANFNGSDSFGYAATDAAGAGINGVASVSVASVNDVPSLLHGGINGLLVEVGGTVTVNFAVSDADSGDSHSYSINTGTLGNGSFSGSTLSYTGTTAGSETLTVTVTDGAGATDTFAFPVTVAAVPTNDANSDGLSDEEAERLGLDPAATGGDSDGDGTVDAVELGDPSNPTDSDGDGVIDALEEGDAATNAGKISVRIPATTASNLGITGLGNGPVTLEAAAGQTLSVPSDLSGSPLVTSGLPADASHSYPLGLYGFSVNTGGSQVATVTLTFPAGTAFPANLVVRKLDASDTWATFPSAVLDRTARTLELTLFDNDSFDRDSGDGIIRDPVGLGVAKAVSDNSDSGGGSSAPWTLLGLALIGLWGRLRRRG